MLFEKKHCAKFNKYALPRAKNKSSFFPGLLLALLPKCPFCIMELKVETGTSPKYLHQPGMRSAVDMNNPKHIIEYKGEKVYFCCDGCKDKFKADPEKYMSKVATN